MAPACEHFGAGSHYGALLFGGELFSGLVPANGASDQPRRPERANGQQPDRCAKCASQGGDNAAQKYKCERNQGRLHPLGIT